MPTVVPTPTVELTVVDIPDVILTRINVLPFRIRYPFGSQFSVWRGGSSVTTTVEVPPLETAAIVVVPTIEPVVVRVVKFGVVVMRTVNGSVGDAGLTVVVPAV
jgi:hypothetical protein